MDFVITHSIEINKNDREKINKIARIILECKKNGLWFKIYNLHGIKRYFFGYYRNDYEPLERLNIFVFSDLKFTLDDTLCRFATLDENLNLLKWIKKNYKLKINGIHLDNQNIDVMKFWIENYNIKKIITIFKPKKFVGKNVKNLNKPYKLYKIIRFKTKKRYFKGYEKN